MADQFLRLKQNLPKLGIGLGLRREIADDTFENIKAIDWLEFSPENYMGIGGIACELLEEAAEGVPLISHGLSLSIGSADELNKDYLKALKTILHKVKAPWFSDHLSFSRIGGVYIHDLLPLPFSKEAINHVSERIKIVQEYVELPFLLENISFYTQMPGRQYSDAEFLSEILRKSDCGLLLDVNNVYVNSQNFGFDCHQYIDSLPLERVVQMHVAGHRKNDDVVIDTHGAPVVEPVFALLQYALERTQCHGVMLERDQNFPEFEEILSELRHIKGIAEKTYPQLIQAKRKSVKRNGREARQHAVIA